MLIHFVGGIHEIYFPYVLMKPSLIIAAIAGGMSGVFTFSLLDAGLVASPSPGSIIALLTMTPRGNYIGVLAGVLVATAVSFLVASVILKRDKSEDDGDLSGAAEQMQAMKGKKSSVSDSFSSSASKEINKNNVQKIVFACDAGMGSSAMGASLLRDKFKKANVDVDVTNTAINQLPEDADLIITHKDLTDRAKNKRPDAIHVSVENFLNSPKYQELIDQLSK